MNQKQTLSLFKEINKEYLSCPVSLIYMNIRSLRLNFNQLLVNINKIINKIKFIILVETNITNNENSIYNIQGFNSAFLNREGNGGGIAVYVKENINFTTISLSPKSCESLQIDAVINNKSISLLTVYRPPDQNVSLFINEIETIISKINKKQEVIIVGDMNIDIKKQNKTTTTYLDMLMSYGMECMINESTREDPNKNTSTCIDHLFIKQNKTTAKSYARIIKTTISDHYSLFCSVNKQEINLVRETRISKGPFLKNYLINKKIKEVNWSELIESDQNVVDMYIKTNGKFNEIYGSSYKTTVKCKKRSSNPWISEELIRERS